MTTLRDAWEENAHDWIEWARTQEHDGFWEGTWPELHAVLPPPAGGLVVEVGCGEGRCGRKLIDLGHPVVGIEYSSTLAGAARAAAQPLQVVRADAADLPLADGIAAIVVACMSLHDIDDLTGAIREIARVLLPAGHLCVAMVHPFASAQDPAAMHTQLTVVRQPYLVERRYEDHMERDGLRMSFISMHRPLSVYVSACSGAGLALTALREFGNKSIPWLLSARFEKIASAPR